LEGFRRTHFASERCLPIIKDVARTGTAILGVSAFEDLAQIKAACKGNNLTVLGNLILISEFKYLLDFIGSNRLLWL
jgi:uroporphyrinogen decarboxylase